MDKILQITKIVGENVRRLREERDYKPATLASKMNVTPQALSGIEHGNRGLSVKQITKLCDALGCQPSELFLLPEDVDKDLLYKQLMAEIKIMSREDLAHLCSVAVSLNAAQGKAP